MKNSKKKLIDRLNRAKGQLKTLLLMLETEDINCKELLIQFQAFKGSVESSFSFFLELVLNKCIYNNDEENLKKIIKLITKS